MESLYYSSTYKFLFLGYAKQLWDYRYVNTENGIVANMLACGRVPFNVVSPFA